jgi:hypothetical protein
MKANRLERWAVFLITLILAASALSLLVSCSPTNQNATSSTQATPTALRFSVSLPTRTPSPSPTATASPTASPTLGAIVLPTPPANGVSLALVPDLEQTGWVSSDAKSVFTPDNNLNVGIRQGQTYASIVQFDLTQFAPGTKLVFAALELSGRNANNLGTAGQWSIDVLDAQTPEWKTVNYEMLRRVPVLFTLGNPLVSSELGAGVRKRFIFSAAQLDLLQKQIDRGYVSVRLSGPTDGGDNFFVWDASPGVREPTLYLVAVPASFTVITTTPTPADVFAAATQIVAQTLAARQIGTPTPLPRSMATATPLPYVVYTQVPTAVNRAEASATAAYVTAVAFTTGTFTPVPLNWYTATPPPLAIPVASLTPVPTTTPTIAPVWLPDLAKQPLPASLYNKIAFLSGDRSNPTAWIIDPDGKNLAQLSDRTYYDIAAARQVVSPDGNWLLYNAPDTSARQILQIWRANLKDPTAPPEQITFHTRGISFAPAWSPDGSKILYTSTKDGREQEIFLFDFNNPNRWDRLSFSQEQYLWNQYPSWSPDSKQIAFSSDRGHIAAYTEIWVMNADGSGAKKLGDGSRDAWAPVWIKWTN